MFPLEALFLRLYIILIIHIAELMKKFITTGFKY